MKEVLIIRINVKDKDLYIVLFNNINLANLKMIKCMVNVIK